MKIDDDHRRIFPTGDWTDDTDQMILIMQSITQQKGNVRNIWDKVFKNGPNKVCLSRPYPFNFLKAVFNKFYLVHS